MSLYDDLDVPNNASAEDITKAYRKKAQKAHPDRNKDDPKAGEKFHALTVAYEILTDPERRKRYDQHGETGVPNARGEALSELAGVLLAIMSSIPSAQIESVDLVLQMQQHIEKRIRELQEQQRNLDGAIKKREAVIKRLRKRSKGVNVLEAMVRKDLQEAEAIKAKFDRDIARGRLMIELLKDYSYDVAPAKQTVGFNRLLSPDWPNIT